MGKGDVYYQNVVKNRISEYMGEVFEDMARYYTLRLGLCGELDCFVTHVGKWWGTDPRKRETADIDIVGLDKQSKKQCWVSANIETNRLTKKCMIPLWRETG